MTKWEEDRIIASLSVAAVVFVVGMTLCAIF